jgi:hypothetical protein
MNLIRQVFNFLSLRERYLLAAFIWVLLFIWGVFLLQSAQSTWSSFSRSKEILAQYEDTLELSDAAEQLLRSARQGLDSSKTFSAAQLVGRLDSIARENEVSSFDISTPSTIESQLFTFNNVRFSIKRTRIEELIRFEQAVKAYSPYIALSNFQVDANNRDPRFLDATLELVSFELKEEALND